MTQQHHTSETDSDDLTQAADTVPADPLDAPANAFIGPAIVASGHDVQSPDDTLSADESPVTEPDFSTRQIILGVVGFVLFVTVLTVGFNAVGVERLQKLMVDAGPLAPLVYIVIKAATYIFAPLTSGPIQVFAGVLFNSVWLGALYTLVGEVIGGSISFWIARRFGRPVVQRLVGRTSLRQVDAFYRHRLRGWKSLFMARIVLFALWDFLSYAIGLTPARFVTYLMVSIVAGALPTIVFVMIGETVVSNMSALLLLYVGVAVLIIVPLLLYGPVTRMVRARQS